MAEYDQGIIGGGQLGRMEVQEVLARDPSYKFVVLEALNPETKEPCPAAQVGAFQLDGSIKDPEAIERLVEVSGLITCEIEHFNARALARAVGRGVLAQPSPDSVMMVQDKLVQKYTLQAAGIPVAPFMSIEDASDLERAQDEYGESVILKTRRGGYDGRGNLSDGPMDWAAAQEFRDDAESPIYAEKVIPLQAELSVLIARGANGQTATYPVTQMINRNNICNEAWAPAPYGPKLLAEAKDLAHDTLNSVLKGRGMFALEMFLDENNRLMINEIAPRVHNSGHWTLGGNYTSQFMQHNLAVRGLPLEPVDMTAPVAVMLNILGELGTKVAIPHADIARVKTWGNTFVEWYGKTPRDNRKLGHVVVIGEDLAEAQEQARAARREIRV